MKRYNSITADARSAPSLWRAYQEVFPSSEGPTFQDLVCAYETVALGHIAFTIATEKPALATLRYNGMRREVVVESYTSRRSFTWDGQRAVVRFPGGSEIAAARLLALAGPDVDAEPMRYYVPPAGAVTLRSDEVSAQALARARRLKLKATQCDEGSVCVAGATPALLAWVIAEHPAHVSTDDGRWVAYRGWVYIQTGPESTYLVYCSSFGSCLP